MPFGQKTPVEGTDLKREDYASLAEVGDPLPVKPRLRGFREQRSWGIYKAEGNFSGPVRHAPAGTMTIANDLQQIMQIAYLIHARALSRR